MATTGRLDLSVWRNDDVWEFPLRVRGPNLIGVTMRAQIRLAPDTPGSPLADLAIVTSGVAEGVRLASATQIGGVWVNDVRIRLNKSTRQGLPYSGELGDATPLAWAMQIAGRTRLAGAMFILAHTIDSDAAPSNRPAGYGSRTVLAPSAGATLTINDDDVVEVVIDGADLIGDFADRAETAANSAEADAAAVADGLASIGTDAPIGPLPLNERPIRETRSTDGKLVDTLTQEGNHIVITAAGARRVGQDRANNAPLGPLIGGERPLRVNTNQDGAIVAVETLEGGRWVEVDEGLVRTEPLPPEPSRYAGEVYSFVPGEQTRKIRFPKDEDVWLFLIGLGQSNMMGQNPSSTAIVGATPIYPEHAFMFEGGPRRNDSLPNRTLVPLIETANGTGQRETSASGWANHLIRDVEAATGRRPKTLSVVCALGATPYVGLNRGSPTYDALLRALDDGVAAIRAKGGRRIITMVAWTQGLNDTSGGFMTPTRYLRQLQQLARQVRADIVERTEEVEPPVVYVVQEGGQVFADPYYAPVLQGDVLADGVDQIKLAGPLYSMPYVDAVHVSGQGQAFQGQMLARAALNEAFGQGWRAVKPANSYWSASNEIVIEFDLPTGAAPLVIDTSGDTVSTTGLSAAGFLFDDGSGSPPAITNVQTASVGPFAGMAVKLTLASAPSGSRRRVGYALKRDDSVTGAYPGQAGPVVGPRGLLRASAGHVSLYGGSTQYDWCNSFVMDV